MEQQQHPEEVVPLPTDRAAPPRLLLCYSSKDGPAHVNAVMQLGAFIQQHMGAQVQFAGLLRCQLCVEPTGDCCLCVQVCVDLWDSLSVARDGSLSWHCQRMRQSDFVLVVCSRGLARRAEAADVEEVEDEEADVGLDCASGAAVQLIGEEVGRAKARGRDLSKYMAAIFEYSDERDIPAELRLVSNYSLPRDLLLLFSHLHGVALYRPGGHLKVDAISVDAFTQLPAGAALQQAISEAATALRRHQPPQGDA